SGSSTGASSGAPRSPGWPSTRSSCARTGSPNRRGTSRGTSCSPASTRWAATAPGRSRPATRSPARTTAGRRRPTGARRRGARPSSAGHAAQADEAPGQLDLAHVAQAVLVDPALQGVQHGDAPLAGHAGAEGVGEGRRQGVGDEHPVELGRVELVEPPLGATEHRPLVLAERLVVADALVDHLVDGALLAVVVDGHAHPGLPL